MSVLRYVRGKPILEPADRFWRMVNKDGPVPQHRPELGQCWLWTGATKKSAKLRYGSFNIGGTIFGAHRASWTIHHGDTTDCVLHKCDNPICVNPNHLFLGTRQDNMRDMITKGRARHDITPRGEQHHAAKLKTSEVLIIKRMAKYGTETLTAIANHFGVSRTAVSHIKQGRIWKHVN